MGSVSRKKLFEIAKNKQRTTSTLVKLEKYGLNAAWFTEFGTEITTAENYKPYREVVSAAAIRTRLKDAKLLSCSKWMSDAEFFMNQAFPGGTELLELPDWAAARSSESAMIEVMPQTIGVLNTHLIKLGEKGMPVTFIPDGTTLRGELITLNDNQEDGKIDNKSYTQLRKAADKKLVNRINTIDEAGRKAYADEPAMLVYFESPWPNGGNDIDDEDDDTPPSPDNPPQPNQ